MFNIYSLISGLMGAIIGGLLTWLITRDSLKKQFENQQKLIEIRKKKEELIALKSLKTEMTHNLIQLENIKNLMEKENMNFINFKESNMDMLLKSNKWEKHNDTIKGIEVEIDGLQDLIYKLQAFYINISYEIANQSTVYERVEKGIKQGLEVSKNLEKIIDDFKNKTEN